MKPGPRQELPPLNFGFEPGGLQVKLEDLLGSHLLVAANSRGGKSWVLRCLLEQTHGRVQHLVIDPEGQLITLRERFAYVLAASEGGDVPIKVATARELARRLMRLGVSAIMDVSDLEKDERDEFLGQFFLELIHTPRELWHPVLVAVDEVHLVAPERGFDESVATKPFIDLASRGLKRGFSLIGATQRLAKFHKSASSDFSNRLFGRTVEVVDRERMGKALGLPRKQWESFQHLLPGEFYACGHAFGDGVTLTRSGPVLTTHPKAGQVAPRPPATPAELKEVLGGLANLAQAAEVEEAEARTVAELEQQVRELKEQLVTAKRATTPTAPPPPAPPPPPLPVPVWTDADRNAMQGMALGIRERLEEASSHFKAVAEHVGVLETFIQVAGAKVSGAAPAPPTTTALVGMVEQGHLALQELRTEAVDLAGPEALDPPPTPTPEKLSEYALELLAVAAARHPLKLTAKQLGIAAGRSHRSSTFQGAAAALKRTGALQEVERNLLRVSALGLQLAGVAPAKPLDPAAAREQLLARLEEYPGWLLRLLIAEYPKGLTRVELGAKAGRPHTSSTFQGAVSTLKRNGLVVDEGGRLTASADLFGAERAA